MCLIQKRAFWGLFFFGSLESRTLQKAQNAVAENLNLCMHKPARLFVHDLQRLQAIAITLIVIGYSQSRSTWPLTLSNVSIALRKRR